MCDPLPQEVILALNLTLINIIYVTKMTSTFPEVRILLDVGEPSRFGLVDPAAAS